MHFKKVIVYETAETIVPREHLYDTCPGGEKNVSAKGNIFYLMWLLMLDTNNHFRIDRNC